MFVMLYWQLRPVISASFGASLDLRKLLAYPIPARKLFIVEILLRITTCAEMLIVIGGAAIGLLRNPLYGLARRAVYRPGALLFAATNILLSAGTRNWLERLFLRTQLKEVLIFLLVIAGIDSAVPRLHEREEGALCCASLPRRWSGPGPQLARLMLHDRSRRGLAVARCGSAVACVFSRWQFERTLRYDATAFARRREDFERSRRLHRALLPASRRASCPIPSPPSSRRNCARSPAFRASGWSTPCRVSSDGDVAADAATIPGSIACCQIALCR